MNPDGDIYASGASDRSEEWLKHARWVRALASDLVRDAATADDLVQETWMAMQRHPPGADVSRREWLARVVKNLALSQRRSEQRRVRREVARVLVTGGSSITLDHVPAGHAQLLDAKRGQVLAEVDVPIGGTARAVLR